MIIVTDDIRRALRAQTAFCREELDQVFIVGAQHAASGSPGSLPAPIPLATLVRMAATLERYQSLCQRLVDAKPNEATDGLDRRQLIIDEIKALLDLAPPIAAPQPPKSRLIIPGRR